MDKDTKKILQDVTRENVLDQIEKLKNLGYYTGMIKNFSRFQPGEDILTPVLMILPIDTNVERVGNSKISKDLYTHDKVKDYEFRGSALRHIFESMGGQIKKEEDKEIVENYIKNDKPYKLVSHQYTAVVAVQGRSGMEYFTNSKKVEKTIKEEKNKYGKIVITGVDEHTHTKNRSKALNGAIRKAINYKGSYKIPELEKGIVIIRFDLNLNCKNPIFKQAIQTKILGSFGLLGAMEENYQPTSYEPEPEDVELAYEDNDSYVEAPEDNEFDYDDLEDEVNQEQKEHTSSHFMDDTELEKVAEQEEKEEEKEEEKNPNFKSDNLKARKLLARLQWKEDQYRPLLKENFGVDSSKDLTHEEFEEYLNLLQNNLDNQKSDTDTEDSGSKLTKEEQGKVTRDIKKKIEKAYTEDPENLNSVCASLSEDFHKLEKGNKAYIINSLSKRNNMPISEDLFKC
jgi:hypothetical protein